MKKILSLVLSLCMLLSLCSFALAEDTITLEFWVRTAGDDYTNEIAAFEAANPGIKVNQVQVASNYDDLVTKYTMAINSKNMPHVGIVGQRHGIPQIYDAGYIVPVDEWMTEEEQADILDGYWVRYTYNGVRTAVPFGSSMPVMHTNATLLAELNLEVPTTFTEMLETAAKAVKDVDNDGVTDIYGFNMASDVPWYIQPLVWSYGGTIIDSEGNVNMTSDEMVAVLSAIAESVKNGVMPANQHNSAQEDFTNGTLLFYFASCASKSSIENAVGDKFDYQISFLPGEEELNVCIGGNGLAVFKSDAAHEEAAAKFVKYMISTEGMESNLERGYMPFSNSQFESEVIQLHMQDPVWKTALDQVQYIKGQNVHPADSIIWSEITTLVSEIEADPDMDILAALEEIQTEVDEFMMFY